MVKNLFRGRETLVVVDERLFRSVGAFDSKGAAQPSARKTSVEDHPIGTDFERDAPGTGPSIDRRAAEIEPDRHVAVIGPVDVKPAVAVLRRYRQHAVGHDGVLRATLDRIIRRQHEIRILRERIGERRRVGVEILWVIRLRRRRADRRAGGRGEAENESSSVHGLISLDVIDV